MSNFFVSPCTYLTIANISTIIWIPMPFKFWYSLATLPSSKCSFYQLYKSKNN